MMKFDLSLLGLMHLRDNIDDAIISIVSGSS